MNNKKKIPREFLGAFTVGNRRSARDHMNDDLAYSLLNRVIESDYKDKEAVEALEYLARFNQEYEKNFIKKGDRKSIHKDKLTDEVKTDKYGNTKLHKNNKPIRRTQIETLYTKENARNRDIFNKAQRSDTTPQVDYETHDMDHESSFLFNYDSSEESGYNSHEDTMIELIDLKRERDRNNKEDDN